AVRGDEWQQARAQMHDVAVVHIRQQRRRGLWKVNGKIPQRRKFLIRSRLVHAIEMRRPEISPARDAQRLDLSGRHQPLGHSEEYYGYAIIVRRPRDWWSIRIEPHFARMRRFDAGAQISKDPRQIVVPAERQDESHLTAQRVAS